MAGFVVKSMATVQAEVEKETGRAFTVSEYAQMRGCSEKTVRRRIAEGKLPVIRTGRRVGIHPRHTYSDL